MQVGDIVGLIQRRRPTAVIVGHIQRHGQPDDHVGVVHRSNAISWHYPDNLYAPGATHANGVTVLHIHDADTARAALLAALNRKQVQSQLRARATSRYSTTGELLWRAASARAEELAREPGATEHGRPEKCHEPWRLAVGDGSELSPDMVAYLDDGGLRTWLLTRLKAAYPARYRIVTMREDLGTPFAMIAELFNVAEPTARWHYWQARNWLRVEATAYYERPSEAV